MKTQFDAAVKLRDEQQFAVAESILSKLALVCERASVFIVLGDVQWEQNKLGEAIKSFRKATELAPRAELPSLGLFHALWEDGQEDDAFEEMKRLCRLRHSKEYALLLDDLRRGPSLE